MTQTLKELDLPTLQQRRIFNKLVFFYKIANGLLPAIQPDDLLTPSINKRKIKPKNFTMYQSQNIVEKSVRNNSKCYQTKNGKTDQYKHSFFIKTTYNWNALCNETVHQKSIETFKSRLKIEILD